MLQIIQKYFPAPKTPKDQKVFFLVSFPRSGNTWTVNSLNQYLGAQRAELLPSPYKGEVRALPNNLKFKVAGSYDEIECIGIKTHHDKEVFDKLYKDLNFPIIYLYRDPRDVMTSFFFYRHAFLKKEDSSSPNDCMINFEENFLEHLQTYLPLQKHHIISWLEKMDNFLPIKYEDLKLNYIKTLIDIKNFLDIPAKEDVKKVFNDNTTQFKGKDLNKRVFTGDNSNFYRKGQIGDWKNYFTTKHIEETERIMGDLLCKLGYRED